MDHAKCIATGSAIRIGKWENKCKQVVFSKYRPFAIVYSSVKLHSNYSVIPLLANRRASAILDPIT